VLHLAGAAVTLAGKTGLLGGISIPFSVIVHIFDNRKSGLGGASSGPTDGGINFSQVVGIVLLASFESITSCHRWRVYFGRNLERGGHRV